MSYATYSDIQDRLMRELGVDEQKVCEKLLEDAAILIDSYNYNASEEAKKLVSIRMVIRSIGTDDSLPIGASQGTMSALGYSQSWTISSGGSVGQLYVNKEEKRLLGCGSRIGSRSPLEVGND